MPDKKKVLFILQLLPIPTNDGTGINFFNYIKSLSLTSDITMVSFIEEESQLRYIDDLKPYCSSVFVITKKIRSSKYRAIAFWNFAKSFFTPVPYHVKKFASAAMYKKISQLLSSNNYDVILVKDTSMAQYISDYKDASKVLFQHYIQSVFYEEYSSCATNIFMRYLATREAKKIRRYESSIFPKFNKILTVTQKDSDYLKSRFTHLSNCISMPVGVDTAFFSPPYEENKGKNILLLGNMYWYPNRDQARWFFKKIFPLVKVKIPDATVTVIGEGAPREILRYSSRSDVFILGHVDDIRPHMRSAALMAVPVRICGGGLRTKILIALASKVPVISTRIGCDGIGLTPGKDIIIADTEEDFANTLVALINDQDLRKKLAINGHAFIEENFSIKRVSEQLEELLGSLGGVLQTG